MSDHVGGCVLSEISHRKGERISLKFIYRRSCYRKGLVTMTYLMKIAEDRRMLSSSFNL